jgi:hypothetical protein
MQLFNDHHKISYFLWKLSKDYRGPVKERLFFNLKVLKCENFHLTDFFYFYTKKSLWIGDFRAKIKNSKL